MNLLGTLMNSGSGNMANLATSLVAQALQNKPGGMIIGGNHFGGSGSGGGGGPMHSSGPSMSGHRGGGGFNRDYDRVSHPITFSTVTIFFFDFFNFFISNPDRVLILIYS